MPRKIELTSLIPPLFCQVCYDIQFSNRQIISGPVLSYFNILTFELSSSWNMLVDEYLNRLPLLHAMRIIKTNSTLLDLRIVILKEHYAHFATVIPNQYFHKLVDYVKIFFILSLSNL